MRANASEPLSARKEPALFCWTFRHAQFLLGLIVVEGDGEVVEEGQHLVLPEPQAFQPVARGRLLEAPPLAWLPLVGGWGIGRQPSRH
jgi:hypothetical protein